MMGNEALNTSNGGEQSGFSGIMQGCPPPPDKRATVANWDTPPFVKWAFQNMSQVFPVAPVLRGNGPASEMAGNSRNLDNISVKRIDGGKATVREILSETDTDGFLVLHRGEIICEKYFNGMTPDTLHLAQSVSKSIIGTLAGIYIDRKLIEYDAPVTDFVPELSISGYAGATVGDILNMRTGVKFNEDYTDPNAEFALLDIASGWKEPITGIEPDTIYDLLISIGKEREHGQYFEYHSIDTDVLGWVCERVGGARLAQLISREIWSKLGVEKDASFTVDKAGTSLADGGFNATLRDFGRFAQMHLNQGFYNNHQIVSRDWVESCRSGETDAFRVLYEDYLNYYPNSAYANHWWIIDGERGLYSARGVFGQLICIDSTKELVVVKLSSWPTFLDFGRTINTYRVVEAIADAL